MKEKDFKTNDLPLMHKVKRIHFVGIGGAGMCGIAEVLLNRDILYLVLILQSPRSQTDLSL